MYTINSFSISKLNNAEITAFFINLQRTMTSPESLGIGAINEPFNTTLQKLIDQVYITSGSEHTASMQAADKKRDLIYKRIRLRLQLVDLSDDNEALSAIRDTVKTHLLDKYGAGVPQLPYQEETAILKGFLYDIGQKLTEDEQEALGISEDVAALEMANNAFITAYNAHSVARAEGDKGVTVKLRGEMCALYQQICFTTQYLANTTDEANAAKATACQNFIGVLNVILEEAKRRYNQRLAGLGDDSMEGGEEGEGHTDSTDSTDSGESNGGNSSDEGGNEGNSGSEGGSTNTGDSGSNSSNPSNPSNGSNPSEGGTNPSNPSNPSEGGNTSEGGSDPNKPNGEGTISDGEITF